MNRLYASSETQAAVHRSREETKASLEMQACTFHPTTSSTKRLVDVVAVVVALVVAVAAVAVGVAAVLVLPLSISCWLAC